MMQRKLWILLFCTTILILACVSEVKTLQNGLTKEATKITETLMAIAHDSNEPLDTMSITVKQFDKENKIVEWKRRSPFDGNSMSIDYKYDVQGLLLEEEVWTSIDSSFISVYHEYMDTLLVGTKSRNNIDGLMYNHETDFTYYKNGKLKKALTNIKIFKAEILDTIFKQEIDFYSKNGVKERTEFISNSDPTNNSKTVYKYQKNLIKETQVFDSRKSLLSSTIFIYQLDEYGNWIEKKSIEDGKLSYVSYREIEYRE